MKKHIINIFILIALLPISACANTASVNLIPLDAQLKPICDQIEANPESRKLTAKAANRGPVSIKLNKKPEFPFDARWDVLNRTIEINAGRELGTIDLLRGVLFELHNAAAMDRLDYLFNLAAQGRITADRYVEKVERIEFENMIATEFMLRKGAAAGIFPQYYIEELIEDFDVHYKIQQLSGHSLCIAEQYEEIKPRHLRFTPYRGNVKDLHKITRNDRLAMIDSLCKNYFLSKGVFGAILTNDKKLWETIEKSDFLEEKGQKVL